MRSYYNVHIVWLALMLLTLSTYVLGELGKGGTAAVVLVITMAGAKGSFIIRDFMQLKGVSMIWQLLMYGWLWVTCSTITVTYILSV